MISYSGSGGVKVGGCAGWSRYHYVVYKYAEGSILCSCQKAAKGKIETVVVKSVRLVQKGGLVVPLYVDTYNGYWNENELCDQATAITTATAYLTRLEILQRAYLCS